MHQWRVLELAVVPRGCPTWRPDIPSLSQLFQHVTVNKRKFGPNTLISESILCEVFFMIWAKYTHLLANLVGFFFSFSWYEPNILTFKCLVWVFFLWYGPNIFTSEPIFSFFFFFDNTSFFVFLNEEVNCIALIVRVWFFWNVSKRFWINMVGRMLLEFAVLYAFCYVTLDSYNSSILRGDRKIKISFIFFKLHLYIQQKRVTILKSEFKNVEEVLTIPKASFYHILSFSTTRVIYDELYQSRVNHPAKKLVNQKAARETWSHIRQ